MLCNSGYQQTLNELVEMGIWAAPFINIEDAEDMSCLEFNFYRTVYKEKYEKELEHKQEIIKQAFEYAGECVKAICKTIASAFSFRKK